MAYRLAVLFSGNAAAFLDGNGFSDPMNTGVLGDSGMAGFEVARASIGVWSKRKRLNLKRKLNRLEDAVSRSEPEVAGELRPDRPPELAPPELAPPEPMPNEPHILLA